MRYKTNFVNLESKYIKFWGIREESFNQIMNSFNLKKIDYFIVDCLWQRTHAAHFNLDQVLDIVEIIKPKMAALTKPCIISIHCK